MISQRIISKKSVRDAHVLEVIRILSRVTPFKGTDKVLAERTGYAESTIAEALNSLEKQNRIYRWDRRVRRGPKYKTFRRIYCVSSCSPDDGVCMLITWVNEQFLPRPYRYEDFEKVCGRLQCSPEQLDGWLKRGKALGLLRFKVTVVPRPEDGPDPELRSDPRTWGVLKLSVSLARPGRKGIDLPPVIGEVVKRNGEFTNVANFPEKKTTLRVSLLALIKKEVELFGACSLTDAALANGIKAARSATQEALARLIADGEVFRQGGRRRVLSLVPIAAELLQKYRAKASKRRFKFDGSALMKSAPKTKSGKRGGRPRKNPIKFTLPEVQRAIVWEFDLLDHPGKLPNEIAITREEIAERTFAVLARNGHQLSRPRVLEQLAYTYAFEQVGFRGRPIIPEFKLTSEVFQNIELEESAAIEGSEKETEVLAPAMEDAQEQVSEGWNPPTLSLNFEEPYAREYESLRREKERASSEPPLAPTLPPPSSEAPSKGPLLRSPEAFGRAFASPPPLTGESGSYFDEDAEKPITKEERKLMDELWPPTPSFTRTPEVKRTPEQEKAHQEYLAKFRRFGSRGSSGT